MKSFLRSILLALVLPALLPAGSASAGASAGLPADETLRHAVLGTWLYEQNAGIATVAMFTIYRDDGIAIQLIKTKFLFKQAKGVYIENRWRIENGTLYLSPVRYRAHSEDAKVDLEEAARQLLKVDSRAMRYQLKGKEREETKAGLVPDDVQAMIDELSRK